jgi:tetratricopeptide (TPR) repeat protein
METRISYQGNILAFAICLLCFAFFFSGCTTLQVSGDVQKGRYALMAGDSKAALGYFQRAAQVDPGYARKIGPVKWESVWTYMGRAQYTGGDFIAARKSLEQARSRHPDDSLAPLYLGLALSRDGGDRQTAAKEVRLGLTGLNDWLEYVNQYSIDKAYWDPGAIIRTGIRNELAAIDAKDINWTNLGANIDRIAMDVEREADEALREKRRERRDSSKGDDKSN